MWIVVRILSARSAINCFFVDVGGVLFKGRCQLDDFPMTRQLGHRLAHGRPPGCLSLSGGRDLSLLG